MTGRSLLVCPMKFLVVASVLFVVSVSALSVVECPDSAQPCDDACYYHGECMMNGTCVCGEGWTGFDCSISTCGHCVHGSCLDNGTCLCFPGYEGDNCDIAFCAGDADCCNLDKYCSDEEKMPDLIIYEGSLDPYLSIQTFDECDCAVDEGCVLPGERLLLRFNTETRNIGDANIQVGRPGDDLNLWSWHSCHKHSHFQDFAEFRLVGEEGEVSQSHKSGFCMVDTFSFVDMIYEGGLFNCDVMQGLQAGWSDLYSHQLDCQWVDLTDIDVTRDWTLELEVNPERLLLEKDYDNNLITLPLECDNSCESGGIARCIFGQCVCMEGVDDPSCVVVDGLARLIPEIDSQSPSPTPSTAATSSVTSAATSSTTSSSSESRDITEPSPSSSTEPTQVPIYSDDDDESEQSPDSGSSISDSSTVSSSSTFDSSSSSTFDSSSSSSDPGTLSNDTNGSSTIASVIALILFCALIA